MNDYSERYKNRTKKVRSRGDYLGEEKQEVIAKLDKYFELRPLSGGVKNPANYVNFAKAVNDYYKQNVLHVSTSEDITIITERYICEFYTGTLQSKNKNIKRFDALSMFLDSFLKSNSDENSFLNVIHLSDWHASIDKGAPQWADHLEISLDNRIIKRFFCEVHTNSPYYRFGVKLFSSDGKLFGDASIQSQMGLNMLIHVAKNFESEQFFVASYKNGIRLLKNQNINLFSDGAPYTYELYVDDDSFLLFNINDQQIHKILIKQEILQRACMFVWGDCFDPDPEVTIKNIRVETTQP